MKSLLLIHSDVAVPHSETPPKLKPFKLQTPKMSRAAWKGLLSLAAIASVLSIAPDALAVLLRRGDVGSDVLLLQRRLGIPADGIFGPQTESAVLSYQRQCGLLVDGIAGPETINSIAEGTCFQGLRPDDGGSSTTGGPFVVVVPGNRVADVSRVVPNARLQTEGRRGTFVNAGNFGNRAAAEESASRLRNNGFLDARVDFLP